MQQQRPVEQAQDVITRTQSLALVQTLVRVSMGCIAYLRDLLPEDAMETKYLRSAAEENAPDLLSSQVPGESPQGRQPPKVKVINRNASAEAKMMGDYLEVGIFDAIQKQYLQSFVFAIYLDPNDPNNVVETYTFSFSYHQVPGTDSAVPMMNLDTHMSRMVLSKKGKEKERTYQSSAASPAVPQLPTEWEVRQSIRTMVKKLTANINTMDQLPRRRFATFKLYFTPETPADYEPPHFVSVEAEKSRLFFSTHDAEELPERVSCGTVRSGHHSVNMNIASLASIIPTRQDDTESENARVAREAETKRQQQDASDRNVVWSAEVGTGATLILDQAGERDLDERHQPIGVRDRDGNLRLGDDGQVRRYVGDIEREPDGLDQINMEERNSLVETQPIAKSADPSSLTRDIDTLQLGDMIMNELEQNMDLDHLTTKSRAVLGTRANPKVISREPAAIHPSSDNHMDIDGAPVRLNSEDRSSQPRVIGNDYCDDEAAPAIPLEPIFEESEEMKCSCEDPAEDGGTIYCDAGCGGIYHVWCMGYMSANDKRLPDNFVCWICKLSKSPQFVLLPESDRAVTFSKLKELALMRRALQVLHQEEIPQTKQLWSARLGFLGDEAAVEDALLQEETQAGIVTTRSGKKPVPKVAKSKRVKTLAKKGKMIKIWTATTKAQNMKYFQPGGSMERAILSTARLDATSAQKSAQLDRLPQRPVLVDHSAAPSFRGPAMLRSLLDIPLENSRPRRQTTPQSLPKRKSNDENDQPQKKPRMAMALQSVGLEQDFD
ncbi:DNA binding protein [Tulasnella sp. JGI-2019a]|nr:DNA binding protein [Tulasnella sp. JGI-2019a]